MRFSQLSKGARAEKATTLRVHGKDVPVLIRPLSALEDAEAVAHAIREAKAKGAEPKEGNPIYGSALMSQVIALAYLDAESPATARQAFFDGGAAQVLAEFDSDGLAMLYEQQQVWQEECAPTYRHKNIDELFELLREIGAESDDPKAFSRYLTLQQSTRWVLLRTSAVLLLTSRSLRSAASSSDSDDTASAPTTSVEHPSPPDMPT